jgi:hypothetical protein
MTLHPLGYRLGIVVFIASVLQEYYQKAVMALS